MLAKQNRFSFKNRLPKQILNSPLFTVRYGKNESELAPIESGLKVGVVVSKKVDKRATVRNRIKRTILEVVQKEMQMNLPMSLVFYAKKQEDGSSLASEVSLAIDKIKDSSL